MADTPEGGGVAGDAISAAAEWLEKRGASRRLDGAELRRLYNGHGFRSGWRLPVQFGQEVRHLDVLLPTGFPNELARVGLIERPPFGTWPHVEQDGLLCLPARLPNRQQPIDDIQVALSDAVLLVEDSLTGRNEDDLRDEFHSYWNPSVIGNTRVVSILEARGPSRPLFVWRGQKFDVVADSEVALRRWLGFKNGTNDTHQYSLDSGLLLWLRQPLLPAAYPSSSADVLRIAEAAGGVEALVALSMDPEHTRIFIVLGAMTRNGAVMAGVGLRKPQIVTTGNGFRRVPVQVHLGRYFSPSSQIGRFAIERADAAWIHGRGEDPRQRLLSQRSVVIIGGGSVGGPLSLALAQAGVGRIDVIDPKELLWGNIGRHPLGAEYVGHNKANALAERIRKSFPHIERAAGHSRRWEDVAASTPTILNSADLIVSAIGDWASESALNRWHVQNGRRRPIVYAWTEAHAAAGHAVAITKTGGCFRCGFSEDGRPLLRVTEWPKAQPLRQEPGCGALFQPYGPVELQHTIALNSELILDVLLDSVEASLHRVWAANEDFVKRAGGQWTPEWRERSGGRGSVVEAFDWPICAACPDCHPR